MSLKLSIAKLVWPVLLLSCASAETLKSQTLNQPKMPVTLTSVEVVDDIVTERVTLLFAANNKSGEDLVDLTIDTYYLDAEGHVLGGQTFTSRDFAKGDHATLSGRIYLADRSTVKSADLTVVGVSEMHSASGTRWFETPEQMVAHMRESNLIPVPAPTQSAQRASGLRTAGSCSQKKWAPAATKDDQQLDKVAPLALACDPTAY